MTSSYICSRAPQHQAGCARPVPETTYSYLRPDPVERSEHVIVLTGLIAGFCRRYHLSPVEIWKPFLPGSPFLLTAMSFPRIWVPSLAVALGSEPKEMHSWLHPTWEDYRRYYTCILQSGTSAAIDHLFLYNFDALLILILIFI